MSSSRTKTPQIRCGLCLLGALALVMGGCVGTSSKVTTAKEVTPITRQMVVTTMPEPSITPTATATASISPTPTLTATPLATATPTQTLGPVPELVASYPVDGDLAIGQERALHLQFSRPMDHASVDASLILSPSIAGEWTWPDSASCSFVPDASWHAGVAYTLTLGAEAQAIDGVTLGQPEALRFETGGRGVPVPILMYHHVIELEDDASEGQRTWTVSPDALAWQIAYLVENGYSSITPMQLAGYLEKGTVLPHRPVMLTFDDGYKELYHEVLPLFSQTNLRPVLFIVPEYLGYGAYLNWDQLGELVHDGCIIGAHGYDHSNLRQTPDDSLAHQIVDSQQILNERLGVAVDAFCYPYGSYDDRVLDLMASSGYQTGYTLNPSIYQEPDAAFQLSRLLVHYDMTHDEFIETLH